MYARNDFGLMPIVPAYNLNAEVGWVWFDMGLLRLLLKLFAPKRGRYRYQQSSNSYRPVSVPVQTVQPSPWEPLRQVEGQTGQQIIRGHCWVIDGDTIVINKVHIRLAGIDAPELAQRCLRNGVDWDCGAAARQTLAPSGDLPATLQVQSGLERATLRVAGSVNAPGARQSPASSITSHAPALRCRS